MFRKYFLQTGFVAYIWGWVTHKSSTRVIGTNRYHETISVRTSQLAYQFYEKNGFVLKEIHKDYWLDGFDMYYMVFEKVI